MNTLYHGSGFKVSELKPGIAYTGEKVEWDETESNEYLYATTDKQEAISQAFASAVEKKYTLNRFQTRGKHLTLTFDKDKKPSEKDLQGLTIYLYTLADKPEDGWVKVSNKTNGLDTEYKTKNTITDHILKTETVAMKDWLKDKTLKISVEGLASFRW